MTSQNSLFARAVSHILQVSCILLLGIFLQACQTREKPAPVRDGSQPTRHTEKAIKEEDIFQEAVATSSHKVALLLPLSGKHAPLGKAMQRAAELALFDKADHQVELSIHDTKSTPEGAQQAAMLAIQNQAGLILGPIMADEVKAVSHVARAHNVNVIAFSNNKAVAGNGVLTLGYSPEEQIRAITVYAAKNGFKSIAVLSPHSHYGQVLDQEISRLNQQGQFPLSEIVHYSADLQNSNKELNPLRNLSYDALFIPEGGQPLEKLLLTLQNANIKLDRVKLLGTSQWDDAQTLHNPGLFGSWIAGPEPRSVHMFEEKYMSAYGEPAPRLASLAYDAVAILPVLKTHFPQNPYSIQALTQPQGFSGVNGIFRFMPDGTAERKLAILEITPAGLRLLQPSAKSF